MKKYIQIGVVIFIIAVLVAFKEFSSADKNGVANKQSTQNQNSSASETTNTKGQYKDGTYTGGIFDAPNYGPLQVSVTITNGKIADVQFLQYPQDNKTSQFVNQQAIPLLKEEAIKQQNASVDIVSGASQSSEAFQQSLKSALQKAS